MEVLKTIGMIIGSLIALIMAFIGFGGIVSSFRKLKEQQIGAITELLIATAMLILSITFLLFSGFYFDILSMEFFKIFFMIFTPLVLAIATYGCFKSKRIMAGIVCILVLFTLVGGAYLFSYHHTRGSETAAINSANQYAKDVTMIQLIASPEKYDGQLVRVIGVGNLEFEGNCISISKEDLQYGAGNSIWIELGEKAISYEEAKKYNGEYVIIEGIFDQDDCGHMDLFCGSIKNIRRYDLWDVYKYYNPLDMYSITKNDDLTYTYKVVDKNGNVLFSEDNATREPNVDQVSAYILGLKVQTGTGLSTNWAVYCDVENSKVSQPFQYVLMAQGNYVIYADYENGEHSVIVQNIFDKSQYYKKHTLANCSPVAGDIVIGAKPNGEGSAVVTYLTGNDYKETDLTINFP